MSGPDKQTIEVFVVNLKRSVARKIYIEQKLQHYDIPFEIFEAVDGHELSEAELNKIHEKGSYFRFRYGRDMNRGEIGCALSHIALYRKISEEKIPYAIVLEDDIEFDDRLLHIVQNEIKVQSLMKHFDLVLLGYADADLNYRKPGNCSVWKRVTLDPVMKAGVPISRCWGTIGYIISLAGAEKLLKKGTVPTMQADFLTSNSPELGVRFGVIRNQIVWPHEIGEESIIGKRVFDENSQNNAVVKASEKSNLKKGLLFLNKWIPIKKGYHLVRHKLNKLTKSSRYAWARINPKLYGYVEKAHE